MDYNKDFAEGFVNTGSGLVNFVRHVADGEKFLFLHGLGGTTESWRRLFQAIPEGFDVAAIDLLGHGKSQAPAIDYSTSMQARAVSDIIRAWGWNGYIVGHSYGGWIAALYAARIAAPKGLVLIDSMGMSKLFHDMVSLGVIEEDNDDLYRRVMQLNENKDYVIKSIIYGDHEADWLTEEDYRSIKCKTIVIWGSDDREINYSYGEYISGLIGWSKFILMRNAGHSPFFTDPEGCWVEMEALVNESAGAHAHE
jgi:pimeloyl-ACP methyl ester carboxylesterase